MTCDTLTPESLTRQRPKSGGFYRIESLKTDWLEGIRNLAKNTTRLRHALGCDDRKIATYIGTKRPRKTSVGNSMFVSIFVFFDFPATTLSWSILMLIIITEN